MSMQNRFAVAALVLVAAAPMARAQEAVSLASGPRAETARAGIAIAPVQVERLVPNAPKMAPSQKSRTLMIVGGAALVGGAIIGDDVGTLIMVGGLGVGLYGLYLYLQ